MTDNVVKITLRERTTFQRRLRSFREARRPTAQQEAAAENERIQIMAKLADDLMLIRMKMAAIGGTEWAASRLDAEAAIARATALKHPN